MAELEKARQQFLSGAVDKLRSTLPKAVDNVIAAVEGGNLKASLELLRCVGLYGDSAQFKPGETDPSAIALTLCLQQLAKEGVPSERESFLIDVNKNPRYAQRKTEILADLAALEDDIT
jgi:hypothetical protein